MRSSLAVGRRMGEPYGTSFEGIVWCVARALRGLSFFLKAVTDLLSVLFSEDLIPAYPDAKVESRPRQVVEVLFGDHRRHDKVPPLRLRRFWNPMFLAGSMEWRGWW
jgi:hypothetical protein